MKKILPPVIITLLILAILAQTGSLQMFGINRAKVGVYETTKNRGGGETAEEKDAVQEGEISYRVKTEGDYFYVYSDESWKQVFWKGVNIGSGSPGSFPGELTITYDTYLRWFNYISEMNANCIRVYTALTPDFYKAFYDFNKNTDKNIYLFQGVWVDEEDIRKYNDVYAENGKIANQFKQDALDMVGIIHGDCSLSPRTGYANGTYTADVSKWFAGWILGMEFDPYFIKNVNDVNNDKSNYSGNYLYTQGSTAFEAFLCEVGDAVIEKESTQYGWQAPVAFSNWVTTDPLSHPEEPDENEDTMTLNTESIKARNAFLANEFASYHVYPYYPDTMSLQKDYISYKDSSGKVNTYEAYLKDLKSAHTMPIIIAEFGVSTSRGYAHKSLMNYNQGGMDETEAGEAIIDMFKSIYKEKYAGGIVFAWQDEWFKRTWNNESFDDNERRPFWGNYQTCEQFFGLLAFEPGETKTTCLLDGNKDDWEQKDLLVTNEDGSIYMKTDEMYVYFMVDTKKGYNFEKDTLLIPIDTIRNQGNTKMNSNGVKFSNGVDFVVQINGKDNTRILCDAYYDAFYYLYAEQYKMIPTNASYQKKDSGIFNKMNMCTGYEIEVPSTKQKIPFDSFETGKLTYGISDPDNENFTSLADFYEKDGVIEVRIPWQLLNFTDPSSGEIMDNFYNQQSITSTNFESFNVGFGIVNGKSGQTIKVDKNTTYKKWDTTPKYHERLKKSYYILQKELIGLGG